MNEKNIFPNTISIKNIDKMLKGKDFIYSIEYIPMEIL